MLPAELAERAYTDHGAELYRFARRWTGDDAAAQDLVQDVIVRAWRAADRFDPQTGSLRTWLFAIARNAAVDHSRSASRKGTQRPGSDDQSASDSEAAVDDVIRADLVARALVHLSFDQRTAIVETYLRDRTYADVASDLGVSESTLRSRVFHGLRALRATMDRMEVG